MKRRGSAGYTIVEVLIVLAVTGGLLMGAVISLSGRQRQTQASESVHLLDSVITGFSREVASGFYPSSTSCTAPAGGGPVVTGAGGAAGGNTGCIFLGKIMNFRTTEYSPMNLLGRQFVGNTTDDVATLAQAQPVKLADAGASTYPFGLEVTKIISMTSGTEYKALAFIAELGGGSSIANNPINGSRSIQLYGVLGPVSANTSDASLPVTAGDLVAMPDGARICAKTANDKYAEITVGSGGNQYTTNTVIGITGGGGHVCTLP